MPSAARTQAACLTDALGAHRNWPYEHGLLTGFIRGALWHLEDGNNDLARKALEQALKRIGE